MTTKLLSLGLCRDGQNNVLDCSTDLKSNSRCDVQPLRMQIGLTSGVPGEAIDQLLVSRFLVDTVKKTLTFGHRVGYRSRQAIRNRHQALG